MAEAVGDLLRAAAADEDGAEGLRLALVGTAGLQEGAAAGSVVHGQGPQG